MSMYVPLFSAVVAKYAGARKESSSRMISASLDRSSTSSPVSSCSSLDARLFFQLRLNFRPLEVCMDPIRRFIFSTQRLLAWIFARIFLLMVLARMSSNSSLSLSEGDSVQSFHAIMREVLDYRKWFEFTLECQKTGEKKKELTDRVFFTFSGGGTWELIIKLKRHSTISLNISRILVSSTPANASCIEYFKQRKVYEKLFVKVWDKYRSLGRFGGTVQLSGLDQEECRQLGGFLQKNR